MPNTQNLQSTSQTTSQPTSQQAILELMAAYNQRANKAMIEVLEDLDEGELHKDRGLYFKSILGTMAHYTAADATFFKDYFAPFCVSAPSSNKIEAMLESAFTLKAEIHNDATNLFAAREEIDSYILQVIASIEDFSAIKEINHPRGKIKKPVYHFVFEILNHATHHRGMVSCILDTMGVENDFNGALSI